MRPLGPDGAAADDAEWEDVTDGSVTAGVPHRWFHPDGRSIDLVFYDGPLSHDLAFALSGLSSQALIARVREAGGDGTPVVVATDGETFGHHHKYADRALAYAFAHEAPANDVRGPHPRRPARRGAARPTRSRCGRARGRAPTASAGGRRTAGAPPAASRGGTRRGGRRCAQALDVLRDHGVEVFERRGAAAFDDPWAARDAYIDVLLGAHRTSGVRRGAGPGRASTRSRRSRCSRPSARRC